jgi:hypothetical protein
MGAHTGVMNTKALFDELRERRDARVARRALERELASYTAPNEVDDLLGLLRDRDDAAAEEIRTIVLRNQLRHGLHRAS